MTDDKAIEVEGLVREFRKGPRAVDGVDLYVREGEIYGFLGPNGAGKSTTVLMLTTLLPPTAGSARVGGFDVVSQGAQVRAVIGAALQEAALDPLLTGREHLRLQGSLHGFSRQQRRRRADELLERVGLTQAADRKIGGYSGGMKRRLDLALALVHGPRILFLDEPTTGLDIQSRTALWEEVARLARDEGATVFLTTQYLEEADALAHRVGIIDHGRIVAEGSPAALKAEIGRPRLDAMPADDGDRAAIARVLEAFGDPCAGATGAVAVRLRIGAEELTDVVRALDAQGLRVADLQLHSPSLDDVFLAKTGRSLEGAGETGVEEPEPVPRVTALVATQVGALARRSVRRTLRQPANIAFAVVFPLILLAVNAGGLRSVTELPGFPSDTYLDFFIAFTFIQGALFATINSGTDLARDIQTGFLNRLSLTPLRRVGLLTGHLSGAVFMGVVQALVYLCVGLAAGVSIETGFAGALVILVLAAMITLGFAALGTFLALRTGSGEAVQGMFPLFFILLFLSSMALPRDLIQTDWFREIATYNPVSYMIEAIRSLIITGWDAQALALGFGITAALVAVALTLASVALKTRLART